MPDNPETFERFLEWGYIFRVALVTAGTLGGLWFVVHHIVFPIMRFALWIAGLAKKGERE